MSKKLLHTPEGVRDIYGEEYARKLIVQDKIHSTIHSYGYQDIQTPTFEFFDVFSKDIGTTPSKELYKFFDKEGNTLVLRPDFTPSIARCAAKYFMDDTISMRFCYLGNTYTNTNNLQGKLKEITEMGAELIGDSSVEADGEMISLVVEFLLNAGLKDFQVSIGQIEYFKGLCEEAGLSEEVETDLRDYISNKNYFAAEDMLLERKINRNTIDAILKVQDLFGSEEVLEDAKELVQNERSIKALDRLKTLYKVLSMYGVIDYVSFDLGMVSKYNYYTGIIFKVYTYGVGDAIAKGGRYDTLLNQFGKNAPAIGFMVVIDDLMAAMSRQKINTPVLSQDVVIVYKEGSYIEAMSQARIHRASGLCVALIPFDKSKNQKEYEEYCKNNHLGTVIFI